MATRKPPIAPGVPGPGSSAPTAGGAKFPSKAWFKAHKGEAIAGGGGFVVLVALYVKSRGSSSTAASTTSSSGAIDPATGLPYSEELAAAQQTSPYTATSGYTGDSGYSGGYGGGGGGGGSASLDTAISGLDAQLAALQQTQTTPQQTTPPANITVDIPPAASTPAAQVSAGTTTQTPAQSAAVAAQQDLAAQTPASQETAAQRHAQEVSNRSLRAVAKG